MYKLSEERLLEIWDLIKNQLHEEFMPNSFYDFRKTWAECENICIDVDFAVLRLNNIVPNHMATLHGYVLSHKALHTPEDKEFTLLSIMELFSLHRLQCFVPCCLVGLCRYLNKIGFQYEGTLRDYVVNDNIYTDVNIYSLLRR